MDKIIKDMLSYVTNSDEIKNCMQNIDCHFSTTLQHVYEACFHTSELEINYLLEIEAVIDFLHDELNTGHWSNVPLAVRRAFRAATYLKALILMKTNASLSDELLKRILKCIDMALLMGAPLRENSDLLNQCASRVSRELNRKPDEDIDEAVQVTQIPSLKRKADDEVDEEFHRLQAKEVDEVECPSIELFKSSYFDLERPVKLKECMTHWPALTKWLDVGYLLQVAGERTVPIEVGNHYADENWSQKLMTLKDFINKHYLEANTDLGYLAQHNLFDQIEELREDIRTPEYCCVSRDYVNSSEPDVNSWFGPKGTVSPLHFDPKDNILAQVFGTKQVLLFAPSDTPYLYPHDETLLCNTAKVDPLNPDEEKYPDFRKATMYKCLLQSGEMLYIPPKWWHHVTALTKSFSVSFWWQ